MRSGTRSNFISVRNLGVPGFIVLEVVDREVYSDEISDHCPAGLICLARDCLDMRRLTGNARWQAAFEG